MVRSHSLGFAIALSLTTGPFSDARGNEAAASDPTLLPRVTVTAEHESDGYLTERSRTATKTEPTISAAPSPVASDSCSSSSAAPRMIATSGFTYWCVTTFEIGAFRSNHA